MNYDISNEFDFYDGEKFITFNVIEYNKHKNVITLIVSDNGRISKKEFDVLTDRKGSYIEYGNVYNKIYF